LRRAASGGPGRGGGRRGSPSSPGVPAGPWARCEPPLLRPQIMYARRARAGAGFGLGKEEEWVMASQPALTRPARPAPAPAPGEEGRWESGEAYDLRGGEGKRGRREEGIRDGVEVMGADSELAGPTAEAPAGISHHPPVAAARTPHPPFRLRASWLPVCAKHTGWQTVALPSTAVRDTRPAGPSELPSVHEEISSISIDLLTSWFVLVLL
jgi:hypothetical protein